MNETDDSQAGRPAGDDLECAGHPGESAVARCVGCEKPVCAACRVVVTGRTYCKACVEAGAARLPGDEPRSRARLAVVALVLSLLWILPVIGIIAAIAGVVLGHVAEDRIEERGASDPLGERYARTAIIVGYVGLFLAVITAVWVATLVTGLVIGLRA